MLVARTPIKIFSVGIVTAEHNKDEFLEPYVRLFRGAVRDRFYERQRPTTQSCTCGRLPGRRYSPYGMANEVSRPQSRR
ncbi:hypothetical protein TNCV_4944331 [Trichonephila clavipes]|nr:hypothetical protein TNCV_4944331 [Trichonephila clavipes]